MRRARRQMALALVLMSFLGTTAATAGGRSLARRPGVVRHRVIVGAAFVDPFYWDPFWYPGFGWGLSYSYVPPPPYGYAQIPPRNAAPVEMHVSPRKSTVIVDGTAVGQARDFNSRAYPLWLKAGTHELELSYRGYQTLRVKFEVKRGRAYRVHYELQEGEGIDPRSNKMSGEPQAAPGPD
jgi:PEGA domain